jgi:hypothetical protein
MKQRTYTVYYLEEEKNELGNPYIGQTYRLEGRSNDHRLRLGLDYKPTLYPIKTFNTGKEARAFEKIKKIETGWPPEGSFGGKASYEQNKGIHAMSEEEKYNRNSKGGETGGNICKEKGIGIFGMSEEDKFNHRSQGGNTCVKEEKGIWSLSKETRFEINSRVGKMMLGKRWINNGTINKIVNPEELEYYYSQGFVNGRFKK